MIDANATWEELYGDVTHIDWCEAEIPEECEGDCIPEDRYY